MKRFGVMMAMWGWWALAGCTPVAVTTESVARQAIAATQQAVGTQASFDAQYAIRTQQALETQQAQQQESAALQVTAQAAALESQLTQQAYKGQLQVLQITAQYLENAQHQQDQVITQVAAQATTTAIVAESLEREDDRLAHQATSALVPLLICIGGAGVVGISLWGFLEFIRARVERMRYIETTTGPMLLLAGGGWEELPEYVADAEAPTLPPKPIQRETPAVWDVTRSGSVVASKTGVADQDQAAVLDELARYRLVKKFLRHAAARAERGRQDRQIPSWKTMGIHSDEWKQAKGLLQAAGCVYSQARKGTWVGERYHNIGGLMKAVHEGRVQL